MDPGVEYFWINLAGSPDRRRFMQEQLARLGAAHTRVEAYPASDLPEIREPEECPVTPEQYGCVCSHLKALRVALEAGGETLVLLEDDTYLALRVDFDALWRSAPGDAEVLQLFTNNPDQIQALIQAYERGELWSEWEPDSWSSGAYVMRREAAAALLAVANPEPGVFDLTDPVHGVVADEFLYQGSRTYTCTYPVFHADPGLGSIINPANTELLHLPATRLAREILDSDRPKPGFVLGELPRLELPPPRSWLARILGGWLGR